MGLEDTLGRPQEKSALRFLYQTWRRGARKSNSPTLGYIARGLLTAHLKLLGSPPPGALRAAASTLQPINPLQAEHSGEMIEVFIPFTEANIDTLGAVINGIVSSVQNPIARVVLATPELDIRRNPVFVSKASNDKFREILRKYPKVEVHSDQEILGPHLVSEMKKLFFERPSGWYVQQLLKVKFARDWADKATLIVDADTVLLEPKTWLAPNQTQLLQFSEEFHEPYMRHIEHYFGLRKRLPVSFVTHHQLMQKSILQEMFPSDETLLEWFHSAVTSPGESLSEYESYGTYLVTKHPRKVAFGTWSNLWSPRWQIAKEEMINSGKPLEELVTNYCSISFHAHSQSDSGG